MLNTKFEQRTQAVNSLLCVGLDPRPDRLPAQFQQAQYPLFAFNRHIIDATHAYVAAYKPNIAFYEAHGAQGWHELALTMNYIRENHPDIFAIADAKRADIGATNEAYARAIFDELGFDAITLHPYLGRQAMSVFLERADKTSIILCRTSNEGAGEFQDLVVEGKPLWQIVAEQVRDEWNSAGNCMLVVGATYPDELCTIRQLVPDMTFLVPGIGVQGGNVELTVRNGINQAGMGIIINSSRGIIFAEDSATAARDLRDAINQYRNDIT
jgi:orotidine-5'-phosphate decarboxylase